MRPRPRKPPRRAGDEFVCRTAPRRVASFPACFIPPCAPPVDTSRSGEGQVSSGGAAVFRCRFHPLLSPLARKKRGVEKEQEEARFGRVCLSTRAFPRFFCFSAVNWRRAYGYFTISKKGEFAPLGFGNRYVDGSLKTYIHVWIKHARIWEFDPESRLELNILLS